ncbi:hypothetical protein SELMODRAFT_110653 [Selaginella moellendorffii]|uniref:Cyclase family protein n=1 Tax=Selaginella moellendorffii TaxID=88036 RepID=D8S7J0_SELML|nr:hypothetical protein SELMODRAFT_110653 [Selaginella moellendorffii]
MALIVRTGARELAAVEEARQITDITHSLRQDLPVWDSKEGLGKVVSLVASIANGSLVNVSELQLIVHTGTHVDSPSHFLQKDFLNGVDTTNSLKLDILTGLVLVVETPKDQNITAEVVKNVVPPGVERVLFRTLNTERRLMWKREFTSDFTALTKDGAEWIAQNTSLKLIGLDYLSVGVYNEPDATHKPLLSKGVVLVEGLNLDNVQSGFYTLNCLPAALIGSDGSPTRCIVTK